MTATLTSTRHGQQRLKGSTGPEVHPSRKLSCSHAPGSPAGGPTGKPHPHTSRLAVVYLGNTGVPDRRVQSPLHTTVRRRDHRGGDPGVGVREARQVRRWDPSRGTCEPIPTCEPHRRTCRRRAAPPGNATRGAPRPCPDPDSLLGARTHSDLAALQAGRPRDSTSG